VIRRGRTQNGLFTNQGQKGTEKGRPSGQKESPGKRIITGYENLRGQATLCGKRTSNREARTKKDKKAARGKKKEEGD